MPRLNPSSPLPAAGSGGQAPAAIRGDELMTLDEAARRLRWRRHSVRQAHRLGLRTVKFGSRRYVLGADILKFFQRLADEQAANGEVHDA